MAVVRLLRIIFCILLVFELGCDLQKKQASPEPAPRPVSVITLTESDPNRYDRLTGSVASWKSEEIGFEVSGRVRYVIEPDTDITGRALDEQGKPLTEPTLLASLDDTRYQLAVKNAEAQVQTITRQRDAAEIEVDRVIPAERRSAEAELTRAKSDFGRVSRLKEQNAATEANVDKARSTFESAEASVAQITAKQEAKRAEVLSLEAQIDQAGQQLEDAKKDLEDCSLVSSFRGQVANVHVIPGGFVDRGQPVLTVQMMDPIKVELEVSAETVRTLRYREMVAVYLRRPDRQPMRLNGVIYMTDPTANTQTRTFTVTLLLRNSKTREQLPLEPQDIPDAQTEDLWKVLTGFQGEQDSQFIESSAIHQDDSGYYVWKVLNRSAQSMRSESSPLLKVKKVRVTPGKQVIPFLGIWTFRDLKFHEGEEFDTNTDLVTGKLILSDDSAKSWEGDTVLFEREQWLIRPGDLVEVDLSGGESPVGYYVPLDAIIEESGQHFVFVVAPGTAGNNLARKVEVEVFEAFGTLRRIEASEGEPLQTGDQIIEAGTHYIIDGEPISVATEVEQRR